MTSFTFNYSRRDSYSSYPRVIDFLKHSAPTLDYFPAVGLRLRSKFDIPDAHLDSAAFPRLVADFGIVPVYYLAKLVQTKEYCDYLPAPATSAVRVVLVAPAVGAEKLFHSPLLTG
mmetsp:Transcript_25/g.42  ORF Transcript_25/g.42 Transcript_25/m.42 type:complete len:116 (-) Transcript_25:203-550(-)